MQLLLALPASYNTPSTLAKPTAFSASPTLMDVSTAQLALLAKPASKVSTFPHLQLALTAKLISLDVFLAPTLLLAVSAKISISS